MCFCLLFFYCCCFVLNAIDAVFVFVSCTGGGSNVFVPSIWPAVGGTIARRRNTPWSYIMNVCTHSYR